MIRIDYDELETAFEFVSFDSHGENQAFICLETGRVYLVSDYLDEGSPPDLEKEGNYLEIPSKRDLGLGRSLALRFAAEHLSDDLDSVYSYFRKSGAFSRFKELLEVRESLQQWYDYERNASKKAIVEWCRENSIDVGT